MRDQSTAKGEIKSQELDGGDGERNGWREGIESVTRPEGLECVLLGGRVDKED